jgi:hypothetical protein
MSAPLDEADDGRTTASERILNEIIDLTYQGSLDPGQAPEKLREIRTLAFDARFLCEAARIRNTGKARKE